jgi:hypothetical protein
MEKGEVVARLQEIIDNDGAIFMDDIQAIEEAMRCVELVPQLAEILFKIMLNARTRPTGVGMQCVHRFMFDISNESYDEISELIKKAKGVSE